MSAPRVLMLIQRFRPAFTGHGIQIEAMAKELVTRGARVEILTHHMEGTPCFEAGAVPVRRFPMTPTRNLVRLWWDHRSLLRYLHQARRDFDILHVHGAPPGLPFVLGAAREAGLRTVITTTLLRSDDPLTLRGLGRFARWRFNAYRSADRFVAICPALADMFPRAGIDSERVRLIPVGVSVERFHPAADADAAAAELGWPVGVPRALFVGAVLRRKGVDVLLDAWEQVLAELPDARLFIAGPFAFPSAGEAEAAAFADACRARTERPPLAGRVQFLGPRDDAPALYRGAHVFLFPSRLEGFPNVLLEALASGTPPVTARIPGSTDVSVRDGETGFVVGQEDAAALASRTVELFRDGALRRRFAEAARADVERRYAMPVITEAHLSLYGELLQGGGGR